MGDKENRVSHDQFEGIDGLLPRAKPEVMQPLTPARTAVPAAEPRVVNLLDVAIQTLKSRRDNPAADSPLYPYREKVQQLLAEGGSHKFIAETFTAAGIHVSATSVARFIDAARIRRTVRRKRTAIAVE